MIVTDADQENEIARINAQKALSDENAAQAKIRANKSIKAHRKELRAQERQLEEREERLKRLETEAVKRVQLAEERANEAEKQVASANAKKERATYALRKYKSKEK